MKKNLPDRYFYPAVFIYEDGQEIAVDFPDLGVATSGTSEDDALLSARELLGCVMCGLEEDGEPIPAPPPCRTSTPRTTSGWCWSMPICPPSGWPASIAPSTARSLSRRGSTPQPLSAM